MEQPNKCKHHVLVVEDDPNIGRIVSRILKLEGFSVDLCDNGLSAREAAAGKKYLFCVSDIKLPGLNGIQLNEALKATNPHLAGHTIFMTGDSMGPDTHAFLQALRTPWLMKPFHVEELMTAVRKMTAQVSQGANIE
jgi:two-component system, OmpR family, copper resistance phosphate regulon response regulator CusR